MIISDLLLCSLDIQLKEKQGQNFLPTLKHSYNLELPLYQAYNAFIISTNQAHIYWDALL